MTMCRLTTGTGRALLCTMNERMMNDDRNQLRLLPNAPMFFPTARCNHLFTLPASHVGNDHNGVALDGMASQRQAVHRSQLKSTPDRRIPSAIRSGIHS